MSSGLVILPLTWVLSFIFFILSYMTREEIKNQSWFSNCSLRKTLKEQKNSNKMKYKQNGFMWFRTIFGSIRDLFCFICYNLSKKVKKEFSINTIKPSEMIQGNLKSQKRSLLDQNIQQYTTMGKIRETSKVMSRVKW